MLGKLMKHEFRATGRIGLPLCGLMLALSVVAGMVVRFWGGRLTYGWQERIGSLIVILYGVSIFAAGFGIFYVLLNHFKRNLLGDEGYLMRTLPVSMHELLLSKLFTALLWYVAAMALTILSGLAFVLISSEVEFSELGKLMKLVGNALSKLDVGDWTTIILVCIGACAFLTLFCYACFTLNQSFSKNKLLYNVMGVVIFIVLLRLIFGLNNLLDSSVFHAAADAAAANGKMPVYVSYVGLIELYIFDALLYFLTWGVLKLRPNLE
ncbi:MAG: hypothetical protein E7425_00680 [Ruminococcaceae bacterium]|nr:hypothetical protein [Oscillospiraceae bacterium]